MTDRMARITQMLLDWKPKYPNNDCCCVSGRLHDARSAEQTLKRNRLVLCYVRVSAQCGRPSRGDARAWDDRNVASC